MYQIIYEVPTMNGGKVIRRMTAETGDEAMSICDKANELGYNVIDVNNGTDEEFFGD